MPFVSRVHVDTAVVVVLVVVGRDPVPRTSPTAQSTRTRGPDCLGHSMSPVSTPGAFSTAPGGLVFRPG